MRFLIQNTPNLQISRPPQPGTKDLDFQICRAAPDAYVGLGLAPVIRCAWHEVRLWAGGVMQHRQAAHAAHRSAA